MSLTNKGGWLQIVVFLAVSLLNSVPGFSQLNIYNWPEPEDVTSSKYVVRAREIVNGNAGEWVNLSEFYSVPRAYNSTTVEEVYKLPADEFILKGGRLSHKYAGGDAVTGLFTDRSLTWVQFSFSGSIELEVTKNYGSSSSRVEIAPKAFGINPHYFNGKTVRFLMHKPEYISVNFIAADNMDAGQTWEGVTSNNIKNPLMIFADIPEEDQEDYTVPNPDDPGVVVWDNEVDIESLRDASVVYFPAGDYNLKNHRDNVMKWEEDESVFRDYPLYHGQYRMKKTQKIYLEGGAYVRGCFHANGNDNAVIYGRGIISGKNQIMHEVLVPEIKDGVWQLKTATKEAFIDWIGVDDGKIMGVTIADAYHHTCPSGKRTFIKDVKIIGWASNNDGVRPSEESIIDHVFIKSSDDLDYARSPHIVKNSVLWPMRNGAVGQMGWNNLGTGFAEYKNNYLINAEWDVGLSVKGNQGFMNGGVADDGMKLQKNIVEDLIIENRCNYLVGIRLSQTGTLDEGYLKNFLFKNILVESNFQTPGGVPVKQEIKGLEDNWIEGFRFTNLIVNGVLVTWDNYRDYFNLELSGSNGNNTDNDRFVKDMVFDTEGDLYSVSLKIEGTGSVLPRGKNDTVMVIEGKQQTFSFVPGSRGKVKYMVVDGDTISGSANSFTFFTIGKNHRLEVHFSSESPYYDSLQAAGITHKYDTAYLEEIRMDTFILNRELLNTEYFYDTTESNVIVRKNEIYKREMEITTFTRTDTLFMNYTARGTDDTIRVLVSDTVIEVSEEMRYLHKPSSIPGRVEAENYDTGGEGVAYHDVDSINFGNIYRPYEFVDVQEASGGGYNVGWMKEGEWLKYSLQSADTGFYRLDFLFSTPKNNGQKVRVYQNDIQMGDIVVPYTGNWQAWATVGLDSIYIARSEGVSFTLEMLDSDFNLDYIDFVKISPSVSSRGFYEEGTMDIRVYPNPASECIRFIGINDALCFPVDLRILSIQGKIILIKEMNSPDQLISTGDMPGGLYFYSLNDNKGGYLQGKFIRQ